MLTIPCTLVSPEFRPQRATPGAAAYDLRARITQPVSVHPGRTRAFSTGVSVALPEGTVGLICPRSGLAVHYGVTVANAPGVIDPDFRGEIQVLLQNHGLKPFIVEPNDRIAQLLFLPTEAATFQEVENDLPRSDRGTEGFGSTGVA